MLFGYCLSNWLSKCDINSKMINAHLLCNLLFCPLKFRWQKDFIIFRQYYTKTFIVPTHDLLQKYIIGRHFGRQGDANIFTQTVTNNGTSLYYSGSVKLGGRGGQRPGLLSFTAVLCQKNTLSWGPGGPGVLTLFTVF